MVKDGQIKLNGNKLKQLRREHGLSQEALVEATAEKKRRVSIATIKRAEAEKPVTYRTLKNLASFFGLEANELQAITVAKEKPVVEKDSINERHIVCTVKMANSEQEEAFLRKINRCQPTFVEKHRNMIFVGINYQHYVSDKGLPVKSLTIFNRLFECQKEHSSFLSPVFSVVQFLRISKKKPYINNEVITCTIHLMNLITANNMFVDEKVKSLFELEFDYEKLELSHPNSLWLVKNNKILRNIDTPILGREKELLEIKSKINDIDNRSNSFRSLVCAGNGLGKTRMLIELAIHCENIEVPYLLIDFSNGEHCFESIVELIKNSSYNLKKRLVLLLDNFDFSDTKIQHWLMLLSDGNHGESISLIAAINPKSLDVTLNKFTFDCVFNLPYVRSYECAEQHKWYPQFSKDELTTIQQLSQGNPLYLNLLLKSYTGTGYPDTLLYVVEQKLDSLDLDDLKLVQLSAAASVPIQKQQACDMLGYIPNFEYLNEVNIIKVIKDNKFELIDKTFGLITLQLMDEKEKKDLHLNIARFFEMSSFSPSFEEAQFICQQYKNSNDKLSVALYLKYLAFLEVKNNRCEMSEIYLNQARDYLLEMRKDSSFNNNEEIDSQIVDLDVEMIFFLASIHNSKKGFMSPVMEDLYQEIVDYYKGSTDTGKIIKSLCGEWMLAMFDMRVQEASRIAYSALDLSKKYKDDQLTMLSLSLLSNTSFYLGNYEKCYQQAAEAQSYFNDGFIDDGIIIQGQDPRLISLYYSLLSSGLQQLPEQAEILSSVITIADTSSHSSSKAAALHVCTWYFWQQRDSKSTLIYASKLRQLAEEESFPFYIGIAHVFEGWARYVQQPCDQHIEQIVIGYKRWLLSSLAHITYSVYSIVIAEVLLLDNHPELALDIVNEAINITTNSSIECYLPELYSLKALCGDNTKDWLTDAINHKACAPLLKQRIMLSHGLTCN